MAKSKSPTAVQRAAKARAEVAAQKERLAALKAAGEAKRAKKAATPKRRPTRVLKLDKAGKVRDSRGSFVKPPESPPTLESMESAVHRVEDGPETVLTTFPDESRVAWKLDVIISPPAPPHEAAQRLAAILSTPELIWGFVTQKAPAMVLVSLETEDGKPLGTRSCSNATDARTAAMQAVDFVDRLIPLRVGNYTENPFVTGFEFRLYRKQGG